MYLCDELTTEKVMEFITKQVSFTTFKLIYALIDRSPGVPSDAFQMTIASHYRRLRIDGEKM